MSELVDKIEEKSKENNSSADEEEEPNEYDNLAAINDKEKKTKKKKLTTKGNSLKELKNKNPRLSCQPILSFLKKHESNYGIRSIPLRKKTTAEYYRNHDDNNVLSTFIQSKINNIDYLKSKEGQKSNNNNLKRNNSLNNNNIEIDLKNEGYKKLKSKLNLYERGKKYLQRKENYIKKKNDLKLKEANEKLKGPFINRNSEIIMENKSEYTPIQKRAVKLHNMHLFECLLNENRIKLKKL